MDVYMDILYSDQQGVVHRAVQVGESQIKACISIL